MQEVKGDALLEARETNLANALTGKVSGVQIIRSSNGLAVLPKSSFVVRIL